MLMLPLSAAPKRQKGSRRFRRLAPMFDAVDASQRFS
jgi:hypothetical protein